MTRLVDGSMTETVPPPWLGTETRDGIPRVAATSMSAPSAAWTTAAVPVAPGGVACWLAGEDRCVWAGLEVAGLVRWLVPGLAATDCVAPDPQAAVAEHHVPHS